MSYEDIGDRDHPFLSVSCILLSLTSGMPAHFAALFKKVMHFMLQWVKTFPSVQSMAQN